MRLANDRPVLRTARLVTSTCRRTRDLGRKCLLSTCRRMKGISGIVPAAQKKLINNPGVRSALIFGPRTAGPEPLQSSSPLLGLSLSLYATQHCLSQYGQPDLARASAEDNWFPLHKTRTGTTKKETSSTKHTA